VAKRKSVLREYIEIILVAALLFFFIRTDVVQAFRIPSESMEDTLLVGDFLLVNKFIYGARIPLTEIQLPPWRDPQPGDVLVFPYPRNPDQAFIKRCIAVEGQTVEIKDKVVYVDNEQVSDPSYAKFEDQTIKPAARSSRDNWGPKVVPKGRIFVMGDNRDYSSDSRYWGFVDKEAVVGKAFIIYWSWARQNIDPELLWSSSQPLESMASLVQILGYSIVHIPWRVRWNRIGRFIE
jgi:signal peptidase I